MLLALTGFVMIGLLMYFLLKGKAIPVTLFVVLPIIGALINGFGIADITDYIKSGVSTTWGMAALFVFVITYFGIMTDVGMFDKLVKKLIKIANGRVLGILLVVVLVSILGHLDGNSPTTYLIVIPAMAPLCKKLNIRISTIMMVCTATITVMNLVPWGGVLNRQSITLAMDSNELWHMYLPLQVCGLVCCVGLAVIMARVEVKRGAGKIDVSATQEEEAEVVDKAAAKLLRPKLLWYNVLLTVVVFVLLFTTKLPNYFIFMLGCVFALVVNFPDPKEQEARLAAHAPKAISLVATVLAAGVMVGILNNTGMIVAMAEFIINILPAALAKHLHLVFAFLGGSIVLPEMLFSFQNRYPNIQLAITEGTSLTLEKLIDNNELDLALMHLPLLCEHAGYTRVSDDRYVMAIAKDNPLTRKAYSKPGFAHLFLDPALAAEQQFILAHPQQRVRQISDRILRHAGIVPKIRLETSSIQSALCFASNDLGITFAPESYIPLFNAQKELAYFYLEDKYEAFWTFCVVYPQNVTPSTPARFFLQETQRLFGR